MYLDFMSFLHIDMTPVVDIQTSAYLCYIVNIMAADALGRKIWHSLTFY